MAGGLTAASAVVLLLTVVAIGLSYRVDAYRKRVQVGEISLTVASGFNGPSLVVYNTGSAYLGGIVGAYGSVTGASQQPSRFSAPGVSYWRHRFQVDHWWTAIVSLYYPLVIAAVLPGWWLWRMGRRRRPAGCCPGCGYDLRGSAGSGRCPECGLAVKRPAVDPSIRSA